MAIKSNDLKAAVNNKYNQTTEAISKQEAVITTTKNENRGRRRIYKTDDAVKNVNGYIYLVDYLYLCKLSYTLEKTQTNLINVLLEDLYKYFETSGKSIDDMKMLTGKDQILHDRNPDECIKVNLRLFKDVHAKYVTYRKKDDVTIADFFAAVMDYHIYNNKDLQPQLKEDPYLEKANLKIVSMNGKARFRNA